MKRALLLAPALVAAILAFGRVSYADYPFSSTFDLTLAPSAPNVNDPVTTIIDITLPLVNQPFLDASITTFSGIDIQVGAGAVGDAIGQNSFSIFVSAAGPPCDNTDVPINPTFTIYRGHVHGVDDAGGHAWNGYANGVAYDQNHWIADFDDDNKNNIPDSSEGNSDGTSIPESIEDNNTNGKPDGAEGTVEPLFMPLLDAVIGADHDVRGLGNAQVAPGAFEVPVDFVTYEDFPTAGTNSTIAVIGSGSGLGLLPANPATATIVTCPPFTTQVINFARANNSPSGAVLQTVASSGPYEFKYLFSVASDWDGDDIVQYNDNCKAVANTSQADSDGDGIGNACDTGFMVPGAPANDVDKDGFINWVDSCPENPGINDVDNDGIADACDPDDRVEGDGNGYATPSPGVYYDKDRVWTDTFTPGSAEGSGDAVETVVVDSNDDAQPDAVDADDDSDGDGVMDNAEVTASTDPLDRQGVPEPSNRATTCAANGPDCDFNASFAFYYGDGCKDSLEAGKGLDSTSPWDFYSVPVPALPAAPIVTLPSGARIRNAFRDNVVSTGDAQAVFNYFKLNAKANTAIYEQDLNGNGVKDGWEYDRSITGPGVTQAGPPDGAIGSADAQKAFAQFKAGLKCSPDPYYNMND